jgi:NADPH:quinone reductase-like Zn-dependent oxidoreductase
MSVKYCIDERSDTMAGYDRIAAQRFGGPEVLELQHVANLPEPGEGEARLRVEAAGVGYTDTILRRGRYVAYTGGLPLTPGYDVVGLVDAVGPGVTGLRVGDRVADMPVHGAYGQFLVRPASDLIPVPAGVDAASAVEVPLMSMTAWQMLTRIAPPPRGASILVVGASGAVGRALVMLGRHLGLAVIGSCSTANRSAVEALGAQAIDYRGAGLQPAILSASGGRGVAAAFDAIGGQSWETSWRALAPGGVLVGYGFQDFLESNAASAEAGKAVHRFTETWNAEGRSDGSDRSTVFYDIRIRRQSHPQEYRHDAEHLLGLIAGGGLAPPVAEILPLADAAEAHRRVAAGGLRTRLVLRP